MKDGRVFLYPFLVCLLGADGLFLCLRGGGYANSIQNPGHSLDLNPIKIRKLLITTGVYESEVAEKVQDTFEEYREAKVNELLH